MSRSINVSPLHPACGYHCKKCTDHIVYTQTEVRTLYCLAVEEEDLRAMVLMEVQVIMLLAVLEHLTQ